MSDLIERQAAIDAIEQMQMPIMRSEFPEEQFVFTGMSEALSAIKALPSAQPEWNNHTVACLLAEIFDDTCACNYNGIDEWLPEKCELLDSCPNTVGVACWEQFLKHKAERRSE